MVFPVTASWDHFATDACPWVMPACYLKVSNKWPGTLPHSRSTTFASSRSASESPSTTPAGRPSLSWWPCGSGCEELVSWRESRPIPCPHSEAWYNSPASPPTLTSLHGSSSWTLSWGLYTVGRATHIPGVSNRLPDELSWLWAPKPHPLPQPLQRVPPQRPPVRDRWFWKTPPGHQGTTCYGPGLRGWISVRSWVKRVVAVTRFRSLHGTRGFIVGPCSRVRLHHSPRDLHRQSPPVAPTLPHTTLWYQPSPMVLLWLLIAEGANGRRLVIANDPRALRSAVRELQGRVYAESSEGPHARELQTWADVVKATGRLDPWCLAPSILYDTSAALRTAGYRSLDGYLSAVKQELILNHGSLLGAFDIHSRRVKRAAARAAAASGSPAVLALRPSQRLGATISRWRTVPPTTVAHCLLLVDAQGNRGAQRCAPVCVLLVCRSVSGAAHKQDPLCGASHNQIPGICLCHWAKELVRTNCKSRSRAPLFPTSSANAATKLQVSSTVRQAAGLLSLPLETLTGACRYSSHTFQGHGSHAPRILWYRRMEDPAARPLGFQCCLEVHSALTVGPVPVAGCITRKRSSCGAEGNIGRQGKPCSVAGATLASGDSNSLQALIGNTAFLRGPGVWKTVSP